MNCRTARRLLVPFRDGELALGQATRLTDHLALCPDCCARDAELQAATLDVSVSVPFETQIALQRAIDAALDDAARSVPPPRSASSVPTWAVVALAAALAGAVGWGWAGWERAADRAQALEQLQTAETNPHVVPAESLRPVSWTAEEGWF